MLCLSGPAARGAARVGPGYRLLAITQLDFNELSVYHHTLRQLHWPVTSFNTSSQPSGNQSKLNGMIIHSCLTAGHQVHMQSKVLPTHPPTHLYRCPLRADTSEAPMAAISAVAISRSFMSPRTAWRASGRPTRTSLMSARAGAPVDLVASSSKAASPMACTCDWSACIVSMAWQAGCDENWCLGCTHRTPLWLSEVWRKLQARMDDDDGAGGDSTESRVECRSCNECYIDCQRDACYQYVAPIPQPRACTYVHTHTKSRTH